MEKIKSPKSVSWVVRIARENKGMSQRELAEAAGVSLRTIVNLEGGRANNIGLGNLVAILNTLGMSLWSGNDKEAKAPDKRPSRLASHEEAIAYMFGGLE